MSEVHEKKWPDSTKAALQMMPVLECVWTDVSVAVYEEARQIWQDHELGNDWYYFSYDSTEHGELYPEIAKYIDSVFPDCEHCLVHWWW